LPGCIQCHAYTNLDDPSIVSYFEEWEDAASLDTHLRSDSVRVLLSAMELACAAPVVRFDTLSDARGIEVIAMARASSK
jgi:quinol monooxygenase YgiN